MSDVAFADVTEQVLNLSYEQTIVLMEKMLENLRTKQPMIEAIASYKKMENSVSSHTMNSMWEELKNDVW
ncbi:hypothetical protein E4N72_11470 [Treponema vincentii]|uniref:hypothetical protein n=1 Tax=Treponema vincentii TaxID=69710 RepID=UPI0020A3B2BF|nr:hypothetical protein [Treponema vincentii]UTC47102.1 hypothetical protein E4N72_11470 [Treponema vincentii]